MALINPDQVSMTLRSKTQPTVTCVQPSPLPVEGSHWTGSAGQKGQMPTAQSAACTATQLVCNRKFAVEHDSGIHMTRARSSYLEHDLRGLSDGIRCDKIKAIG